MTKYPSRKARKAATRAELKTAALKCFAEFGVADTSIAIITKAAGVAHGTFYVHFRSKDELLDEFANDFNQGLLATWTPLLAQPGLALATLVDRFAGAFFDYWTERRQYIEIYLDRYSAGIPLIDMRDGVNKEAQNFIMRGMERTAELLSIEGVDLNVVQHVLAAMWLRTGMQVIFSEDYQREPARRTLVTMTLGALNAALPGITDLTPEQLAAMLVPPPS